MTNADRILRRLVNAMNEEANARARYSRLDMRRMSDKVQRPDIEARLHDAHEELGKAKQEAKAYVVMKEIING